MVQGVRKDEVEEGSSPHTGLGAKYGETSGPNASLCVRWGNGEFSSMPSHLAS